MQLAVQNDPQFECQMPRTTTELHDVFHLHKQHKHQLVSGVC